MRSVAFISEIVPLPVRGKGAESEVHATAESTYDQEHGRLHVRLECSLRRRGCVTERVREPWLPDVETVTESVPIEEAVSVTKDIFHSWIARVRRAIAAKTGKQPAAIV